jgi:hypothetical protein
MSVGFTSASTPSAFSNLTSLPRSQPMSMMGPVACGSSGLMPRLPVVGPTAGGQLASPDARGSVIACYYVLAYLGFAVPYLVNVLGAVAGRVGAFGLLTAIIAVLALWATGYAIYYGLAPPRAPEPESTRGEGRPFRSKALHTKQPRQTLLFLCLVCAGI